MKFCMVFVKRKDTKILKIWDGMCIESQKVVLSLPYLHIEFIFSIVEIYEKKGRREKNRAEG